jgi:class 3 adenylate cyclase
MTFRRKILTSASEDRLEQLIAARLKPGAKKKEIDQRIWDLFGETWCVMFTDLSGFSRNVAKFGIVHFLQTIYENEHLLIPIIEDHDGILLKVEGDSMLVIFRNVNRAIECAIKMQKALKKHNSKKLPEEKVLLCLGLGYGLMLRIGDEDVFGAEVNASSKLGEDTAKAEEILVTEGVKENAGKIPGVKFQEIPEIPSGAKKAYKLIYKL